MSTFSQIIEVAEQLTVVASRLYRQHDVRLQCAGHPVLSRSPAQLVASMQFALVANGIELDEMRELLKALTDAELMPCTIDIADIAAGEGLDTPELLQVIEVSDDRAEPRDVVLNGFGRVGRLLVRLMFEDGCGPLLQLRAIAVRPGTELEHRTELLRQDSIHGRIHADVEYAQDDRAVVINGQSVPFVEMSGPEDVSQLQPLSLDSNTLLIDSTGSRRKKAELDPWIGGTISQVLVTAPCSEPVPNVVRGIHSAEVDLSQPLISAASCTTNAIAPIAAWLESTYGLKHLHMETVHAYTNDQNLVDNAHSSPRRSRAATENMIITATGAQKAVGLVLPDIGAKMTATAVRVPVADVSLLTCIFQLDGLATGDEMREAFRQASHQIGWRQLLGFSSNAAAASSDFKGDRHACVIDGPSIECDADRGVLQAWYDNEIGYCAQVLRLAEDMSPNSAIPSICGEDIL